MTKLDIINLILKADFSDLTSRLKNLMDEDRITTGAGYYVYDPFHFYSYRWVSELLEKASNSKNYFRYIKRISSIEFGIIKKGFEEDMAKTLAFIEEQENLPFEETQKQVLIRNGELKTN